MSRAPATLSQSQVELLLTDPSPRVRAETAAGVAAELSKGSLTENERHIALKIVEVLARDTERQVREAIATHVKSCPFLPRKIANTLARDVESVAVPIIRYSEVLSDDDLLSVVRSDSVAKQLAVAKREAISPIVADALVDTRNKEVVDSLLANQDAELWERSLHKVVDSFGDDGAIQALLVERPMLPLTVTERLITRISAELRERLIDRHNIPAVLVDELIGQGQERAIAQTLVSDNRAGEVERLAASLFTNGKLTPTLVLRALCLGDLRFFEASMATMAGIPVESTRALLYDRGLDGFKGIYGKTTLPLELFNAFRVAVDVIRSVGREESDGWRRDYTRRIIDRLVKTYREVCPSDLEHVLSQISRHVIRHSEIAAE